MQPGSTLRLRSGDARGWRRARPGGRARRRSPSSRTARSLPRRGPRRAGPNRGGRGSNSSASQVEAKLLVRHATKRQARKIPHGEVVLIAKRGGRLVLTVRVRDLAEELFLLVAAFLDENQAAQVCRLRPELRCSGSRSRTRRWRRPKIVGGLARPAGDVRDLAADLLGSGRRHPLQVDHRRRRVARLHPDLDQPEHGPPRERRRRLPGVGPHEQALQVRSRRLERPLPTPARRRGATLQRPHRPISAYASKRGCSTISAMRAIASSSASGALEVSSTSARRAWTSSPVSTSCEPSRRRASASW